MTNEELKAMIVQRTGVPAELLTGETSEELVTRAREVIKWRAEQRAQEKQDPKDTREQFAAWMNSQLGRDDEARAADPALAALDEIRESMLSYPALKDGGEISLGPELSPKEQFEAWVADQLAWHPGKGPAPKW